MVVPHICLATEDSLSEAIGRRLVSEACPDIEIGPCFQRNGFGYLKSSLEKFCNVSKRSPLLLITDLDKAPCPATLVSSWLGSKRKPDNLIFRVAVREVEAWLIADHVGMKALLGKGASKLPRDPDLLPDPKRALLALAANAPRDVRSDLLPRPGAIASQGLGYNARLGDFVHNTWDPERAAINSGSLRRALDRLKDLARRT